MIERRYYAGIKNLNNLYIPNVDSWRIYDNSENNFLVIAEGSNKTETIIFETHLYSKIKHGK